jgi:ribulose-phosphate 3-epimerase
MMVSKPEQWISDMADAGVDQYTFHIEPVDDVSSVCRKVREAGMKVGLAIKPKTPVEVVEKYVEMADLVLIMTVEPGFGGQKFMDDMMPKVKHLRDHYPTLNIEVDGGVALNTIDCCAKAGANWIVSGTGVIKAADQGSVIRELRNSVTNAIAEYSK